MAIANFRGADLSVRNLAFTDSSLTDASGKKFFAVLGRPELAEVVRQDGEGLGEGVPERLVKPINWDGWLKDKENGQYDEDFHNVRVINLGEAFSQDAIPETLNQSGELEALETIFTDRVDHRQTRFMACCCDRERFSPPSIGEGSY
jgi:hypothetical protein